MTTQEIFEFLNSHPIFYLATADGDQARVRGIMLHKADEKGLVFTTAKYRDVYKQLITNPKVELCFHEQHLQIRVTGIAEEIDEDIELKKEIVAARDFMKPWIAKTGYEPMGLFRVTHCVATTWTMTNTLAPKIFVNLTA
ncbi:MAG: pyridoxamine 5'-phosphate oxidase family protein [Lentimicrobiaceae bacterium]|nr:pyridoxamine 5'-phosphate oxidase family protein [Lentimicrobiaceae bacterium]